MSLRKRAADRILDSKITDRALGGIDKWIEGGVVPTIGRGNPDELERKAKQSKRKTVGYGVGVVTCAALIGETDGIAHVGAITGTGISVLGAWNNILKVGVYGAEQDMEQVERIRERYPDLEPQQQTGEQNSSTPDKLQ